MWILEKCEDAWTNYFTNKVTFSTTVTPLKGISIDDKEGPVVISLANSANEIEFGSGVYAVEVLLSLRIPYTTDAGFITSRNNLVDEFIQGITNNNNIISNLNEQATDLCVLDVHFSAHNNEIAETAVFSNFVITMFVINKTI